MDYSMESLSAKFSEHAIEAKKINDGMIKAFKENYPADPLPEHFTDDFSLPLALASICREILKLKAGP